MKHVMYGTLILTFSSDIFFRRTLFNGDLTGLSIPMNHYAVDEKKNVKPIRLSSVAE